MVLGNHFNGSRCVFFCLLQVFIIFFLSLSCLCHFASVSVQLLVLSTQRCNITKAQKRKLPPSELEANAKTYRQVRDSSLSPTYGVMPTSAWRHTRTIKEATKLSSAYGHGYFIWAQFFVFFFVPLSLSLQWRFDSEDIHFSKGLQLFVSSSLANLITCFCVCPPFPVNNRPLTVWLWFRQHGKHWECMKSYGVQIVLKTITALSEPCGVAQCHAIMAWLKRS